MGEGLQGLEGPLVFDTSALFNFGHRGRLESLLEKLASHSELLVPEEVVKEATEQEMNRQYYQDLVQDRFRVRKGVVAAEHEEEIERLSRLLGSGELAVIVLALQTKGTALIDEPEARAAARRLGLKVIGTLGILAIAVRESWMAEQEALAAIQKIRAGGFRIPAVQTGQTIQDYMRSLSEEK